MDTSLASIVVPGLDHSLPPAIAAPLSALDGSSPERWVLPRGASDMCSAGPPTPASQCTPTRSLRKRGRLQDAAYPSMKLDAASLHSRRLDAAGASATKKPRRYSYWTTAELRRLLEGASMAGADFERVSAIVRTRDAAACRKQVRQIASRVRAKLALPPGGAKDECVAIVLNHLQVPRPAPPAPRVPRRPRGVPRAQHKIAIQALPAGDGDAELVKVAGRNPCVEVVLRAHRCVWDVIAHLYLKWGHPLQLVAPGCSVALCVDENVGKLHAELGTPGAANVVRVSYRFVRPQFDQNLMGNPGGKGGTGTRVKVKGGKRTYAPPAAERLFGEDDDDDEGDVEAVELSPSNNDSPKGSSKKSSTPKQHADGGLFSTLSNQVPMSKPLKAALSSASWKNLGQYGCPSDNPTSLDERGIEQSGAHVMGKWQARLDSLQIVPSLPRLGAHLPTALSAVSVPGASSYARSTVPDRDESLALAASELAAETFSSPSRRKMSVPEYPVLSGSILGSLSMFQVSNTYASDELSRPPLGSLFGALTAFRSDTYASADVDKLNTGGPRTPVRESLLSNDNALDIHAGVADESSQSPLPPRLSIGGAEPSLNFSLLFGNPLPSVGRAENSGLVP